MLLSIAVQFVIKGIFDASNPRGTMQERSDPGNLQDQTAILSSSSSSPLGTLSPEANLYLQL